MVVPPPLPFHLQNGLKASSRSKSLTTWFNSKDDLLSTVSQSPFHMDGRKKLLLQSWSPAQSEYSWPTVSPVWIRLKGIPFHCRSSDILLLIARYIGKPLHLDETTASQWILSYAWVLVNLDMSNPYPHSISVDLEGDAKGNVRDEAPTIAIVGEPGQLPTFPSDALVISVDSREVPITTEAACVVKTEKEGGQVGAMKSYEDSGALFPSPSVLSFVQQFLCYSGALFPSPSVPSFVQQFLCCSGELCYFDNFSAVVQCRAKLQCMVVPAVCSGSVEHCYCFGL
ncbi:hypothetical protein MRB53_023160 [Persea americana]|uniref:Uncharacterized protein n=1 Tax=Persea americana TaxID=3435 RepID=A0ACC2L9R1_PERAE|nr:hypothetical protein MRB53_023160 [Persea americana]